MVFFFHDAQRTGLGEGGEIEAQMFNLAQMFIRIPNAEFSTSTQFRKTLVMRRQTVN